MQRGFFYLFPFLWTLDLFSFPFSLLYIFLLIISLFLYFLFYFSSIHLPSFSPSSFYSTCNGQSGRYCFQTRSNTYTVAVVMSVPESVVSRPTRSAEFLAVSLPLLLSCCHAVILFDLLLLHRPCRSPACCLAHSICPHAHSLASRLSSLLAFPLLSLLEIKSWDLGTTHTPCPCSHSGPEPTANSFCCWSSPICLRARLATHVLVACVLSFASICAQSTWPLHGYIAGPLRHSESRVPCFTCFCLDEFLVLSSIPFAFVTILENSNFIFSFASPFSFFFLWLMLPSS